MAEPEAFDQFALNVAQDTWALFRRDPAMFIIAALVAVLVSGVSFGLVAGPMYAGYFELIRRAQRGEPISVGVLFTRFDVLVPGLVASLIIGIAMFIGFCLLVIPGLVVGVFSVFTFHAIAFENDSGIDAIKRSVTLVKNNIVQVLALLVGLMILSGIGSLVVIGFVLTLPLSLIAITLGYERVSAAGSAPAAMAL